MPMTAARRARRRASARAASPPVRSSYPVTRASSRLPSVGGMCQALSGASRSGTAVHYDTVYARLVLPGAIGRQQGEPDQQVPGACRFAEPQAHGAARVGGARHGLQTVDRRGVTDPELKVRTAVGAEVD